MTTVLPSCCFLREGRRRGERGAALWHQFAFSVLSRSLAHPPSFFVAPPPFPSCATVLLASLSYTCPIRHSFITLYPSSSDVVCVERGGRVGKRWCNSSWGHPLRTDVWTQLFVCLWFRVRVLARSQPVSYCRLPNEVDWAYKMMHILSREGLDISKVCCWARGLVVNLVLLGEEGGPVTRSRSCSLSRGQCHLKCIACPAEFFTTAYHRPPPCHPTVGVPSR